jgi:hypothetical protein
MDDETAPAVAEPAMPEPPVDEPGVGEPMGAEPAMAEPMVTEPMVTAPVGGSPAVAELERTIPDTGRRLRGPFLAFYEHYGPALCGQPISDEVWEGGLRRQYFQCLALEEHVPGRVRLVRLGEAWLAHGLADAPSGPAGALVDVAARLKRHPSQRYPERPLADIRYVVLHHTGAGPELGPEEVAEEHVEGNGWPGIGYHFLVAPDGTIFRTQDLTVASYHARQFNPVAVGLALMGDLAEADPPAAQLAAVADVCAGLLADLGLPPEALRGHREMVPTPCPGERFLAGWKPLLLRAVAARLARLAVGAGPAAA